MWQTPKDPCLFIHLLCTASIAKINTNSEQVRENGGKECHLKKTSFNHFKNVLPHIVHTNESRCLTQKEACSQRDLSTAVPNKDALVSRGRTSGVSNRASVCSNKKTFVLTAGPLSPQGPLVSGLVFSHPVGMWVLLSRRSHTPSILLLMPAHRALVLTGVHS